MTLTETLVIIDITKTKSNNCFIIQQETKSVQTSHDCPYKLCIRWCPRLLFQEFTYVYMLWANQKRDGGANQKRDRGFNIHLAGCRIRLKVEVGCGIWDLLKARCGMKVGRQDWDMHHFEGGIGDRMGVGGIMKCIFCELETSLSNACV